MTQNTESYIDFSDVKSASSAADIPRINFLDIVNNEHSSQKPIGDAMNIAMALSTGTKPTVSPDSTILIPSELPEVVPYSGPHNSGRVDERVLSTGDKYSREEFPHPREHLLASDQSDFTLSHEHSALGDSTEARIRTAENVQIDWKGDKVEVTLPDGTKYNPEGNFAIELGGRQIMNVSYQDGQTRISQVNGHSLSFDSTGLVAVSSNSNGTIRQQNIREIPGVKLWKEPAHNAPAERGTYLEKKVSP